MQDEREKEGKDKPIALVADKEVPADNQMEGANPSNCNRKDAIICCKAVSTSCFPANKAEEKELDLVKAQLLAVESELNSYKQAASSDEREKAELIAAEKKARSQVWS